MTKILMTSMTYGLCSKVDVGFRTLEMLETPTLAGYFLSAWRGWLFLRVENPRLAVTGDN